MVSVCARIPFVAAQAVCSVSRSAALPAPLASRCSTPFTGSRRQVVVQRTTSVRSRTSAVVTAMFGGGAAATQDKSSFFDFTVKVLQAELQLNVV